MGEKGAEYIWIYFYKANHDETPSGNTAVNLFYYAELVTLCNLQASLASKNAEQLPVSYEW